VYLETHGNIGSRRAFPTGVLDRWHNCLLIYWRNVAQLTRPHRFVYFCVMTQQDIHSDRQRLLKIWIGTFLVRSVHPTGKIWIDSNGKIKTRHPVEGSFGREFPAICNHCGVITAWSRKTWKFCDPYQTVATARIAPKICQGQPPTFGSHCSRFHPNRSTFVGVIAERVKTVFASETRPIYNIGSWSL